MSEGAKRLRGRRHRRFPFCTDVVYTTMMLACTALRQGALSFLHKEELSDSEVLSYFVPGRSLTGSNPEKIAP